ncbi:class II aldolase and Adducin N-terminal domain-containing protein [Thermothelomyces heterothallicus CBS 202.75]|uniref:class II aldolase and Adducin N-terminal domain-containing protein n=1 Tax=Thermothelomyces heterothallicus CBS 202.75 TaxID=1149848 RepID=UPI003742F9C1
MVSANITRLLATYIDALHILHYHEVLDGYGHLSVRNPYNPHTFFMMRQIAPALVSGPEDIGEYRIMDAEPVNPGAPGAPSERYIHSEVLKRYPGINVALHGHPEELIAYSISNVPLRPVIHMAPFLGKEVPVFNITEHYLPNDTRDFLVRDQRLGSALAALFDSPTPCGIGSSVQICCNDRNDVGNDHSGYSNDGADYPTHNIVLMQSHGFTAVATDIRIATYEGIYAVVNARVQAEALKIQHAYHANQPHDGNDWVVYLNERQIRDSWETEINILEKPWEMWVREVKVNPLYVNELDS